MSSERYYIYAVAEAGAGLPEPLTGIRSKPVEMHVSGGLAACVSRLDDGRLRPQRSNLAAHQDVIRRLTETTDVLPVSFGMIAESRPDLDALLVNHHETLSHELARVGGRSEMSVRATWQVDNIFQMFVADHPELRQLADRIARDGQHASRDQLLEAGKVFERYLDAARGACQAQLAEALDGACDDAVANTCKTEHEAADMAFLVPREGISRFESALESAAAGFDDRLEFHLSGPWAPHHFVSLQLSVAG